MKFFNQLPSNPWAWLFTVIVAVVGVVFAYRSTPQKVIKYKIFNSVLITERQSVMSKLSIFYDGKSIDNLTVSTITFWNNSFPTINNTDIIDAAPLSIFVNNGEILDASVIQGGDTPNRIDVVRQGDNAVKVLFDYIDKKEGGIIQVVHTGKENSIDVSRKIKGGKIVLGQTGYIRLLISSAIYIIFCFISTNLLSQYLVVADSILFILPGAIFGFLSPWLEGKKFIPKNCKNSPSKYNVGIFERIRDKLKK